MHSTSILAKTYSYYEFFELMYKSSVQIQSIKIKNKHKTFRHKINKIYSTKIKINREIFWENQC